MLAAVAFPLAYAALGLANGWPIFREQLPLLLFGVLVAAMIVLKHRTNIARLRAGTEPKAGRRRRRGDGVSPPRFAGVGAVESRTYGDTERKRS